MSLAFLVVALILPIITAVIADNVVNHKYNDQLWVQLIFTLIWIGSLVLYVSYTASFDFGTYIIAMAYWCFSACLVYLSFVVVLGMFNDRYALDCHLGWLDDLRYR